MIEQERPDAPEKAVMPDEFDWWRRALADPLMIGKAPSLMLFTEHPNVGFYRYWSRKRERWVPVAFYRESETGAMLAESDGESVPDERIGGLWHWCCRYPVSYDAYMAALRGEPFHDDNPPPGMGHNLDADADLDEHERLWLEFLGDRDLVEQFLKTPIKTQAEADRAAIWSKRLTELHSRADIAHDAEKRPYWEAGKRITEKWRELREDSAALTKRLKRAQDDFLIEAERQEQARQRAAAAEADRLAREAEIAARQAVQTDTVEAFADAGAKVAAAREAERQAEPRPVQAGRTGAKTSLRTFTSAHVTDWTALALAVIDRIEVRAFLQSLADRAAKGGNPLPGTTISTDRRTV